MLLQLKSVQKNFGGVAALRGANLDVSTGEVHLLMGENGAGKSTLMKIVAGMLERDNGEMLWQGRSVRFRIPPRRRPKASRWFIRNPCWPRTSRSPKIFSWDASRVFRWAG